MPDGGPVYGGAGAGVNGRPWVTLAGMILTTLVVAIALGMAAQVVAERFQLPAILPLLALGVLCGPAGLGWFAPASLGDTLEVLIHLGVAVILFEGGLSLDRHRLIQVGGAVRNLVTLGAALSGVLTGWLAHTVTGMPWQSAALFGAIMTVTGPTVVVPLLHHMIAPRQVKTVLVSEGLITDPLGAVLAYMVLQAIERTGVPWRDLGSELVVLALTGTILGFVAGSLSNFVARRRLVSGELRNLSVLTFVMLCYMVAEHQAHQSGILAVVVMGFTMSAADLPDLVSLKAFKGQLTTLLISVLFILLAGQLNLAAVFRLGWGGWLVAAGLVLGVRPLAVGLSVWPRLLDWRGRVVLAMTAPRGIVAAAVASLAARQLDRAGIAGGGLLEGLVYLAILVTGAWATLMALVLPMALGYTRDPNRRRVVLVGAHAFTELLGKLLARHGRTVVAVDAVSWRLDRFRRAGFPVVAGDARDAETFEEAGIERDTTVIAATTNDELNLLVARRVHDEFGVESPVVALQQPPDDLGRRSAAWTLMLGGRALRLPQWVRAVENEQAKLLDLDPADERVAATLRELERERPTEILKLAGWSRGEADLKMPAEGAGSGWERLTVLVSGARADELLTPLALPHAVPSDDETDAESAGPEGRGAGAG